ncbi:LysE family translocator [Streptomyces stramineus]
MISAGVIHGVLALTGVSLILRAEPALFTAVQWCGAAVMVAWGLLAVKGALRPAAPDDEPAPDAGKGVTPSARRHFTLGLLCTGTNPNVGLFLLAYLPQFVPEGAPRTSSMAVLAAVHLSLAALWLTFVISVIHLSRSRVALRRTAPRTGRAKRIFEGTAGVVFIAFAVRLALSG